MKKNQTATATQATAPKTATQVTKNQKVGGITLMTKAETAEAEAEATKNQKNSKPEQEKKNMNSKNQKNQNTAPKAPETAKTVSVTTYKTAITPVLTADHTAIHFSATAEDTRKEYVIKKQDWNTTADRKRLDSLCTEIALSKAEDIVAKLTKQKAAAEDVNEWNEGTRNDAELTGAKAIVERIQKAQADRKLSKKLLEAKQKTPEHLMAYYIMNEIIPCEVEDVLKAVKDYTEQSREAIVKLDAGETVTWTADQKAKATTIRQEIKKILEPYYPEGFKLSIRFEHGKDETETQKQEVTLLDIIFGTSLPDGRKLYDLNTKQKNGKTIKTMTREFNKMLLRIGIQSFIAVAPKEK